MDDLVADTRRLLDVLPPISGVVGITRSGMIPATVIAACRGVRLWSVDQWKKKIARCDGGARTRGKFKHTDDPILLVDDSVWSGFAIQSVKTAVQDYFSHRKILTAVIYSGDRALKHVDYASVIANEHWFEWNIANAPWADRVGWDIDGVFCRDFTMEEDDDGQVYLNTMRSMRTTSLHPVMRPVHVVTARLEKYREETQGWLDRHGFNVASLTMGTWKTKASRESDDVWGWKANEVRRLKERNLIDIYIESDDYGAGRIADEARLIVVCPTSGKIHRPRKKPVESVCAFRAGFTWQVIPCSCPSSQKQPIFWCIKHDTTCTRLPSTRMGSEHRSCVVCQELDEGFTPRHPSPPDPAR